MGVGSGGCCEARRRGVLLNVFLQQEHKAVRRTEELNQNKITSRIARTRAVIESKELELRNIMHKTVTREEFKNRYPFVKRWN